MYLSLNNNSNGNSKVYKLDRYQHPKEGEPDTDKLTQTLTINVSNDHQKLAFDALFSD